MTARSLLPPPLTNIPQIIVDSARFVKGEAVRKRNSRIYKAEATGIRL